MPVKDMLLRKLRVLCSLAALALLLNGEAVWALAEEDSTVPPAGTSAETLKKFNAGVTLFGSGKFSEAAALYVDVCNSAPNFAEAHMMYGVALMKMSMASEAESELLKANSIKPDLPLVLIDLGSVYQMQGRYQDALAKFNRYLQLFPKGKHAFEVTGLVNALKTEQMRNQGATSSLGKDNYLSEAMSIGAARWRPSAMPLKVFISSGAGIKEYRDEYAGILKEAFAEWVAASQGKITIKFTDNPDDASIVCNWVDDPKQVINPSEGGQALVAPDTSGAMGRTKIKILTQNPGMAVKVDGESVRHICLHEIGHALGLLGHSSQPGDIMFTTVNYSSPLDGLSERDKKTISELYSAPDSILAEHKMKTNEGAMVGSDTNPTNRALRLNSEGLKQIKAGQYLQALKAFEEALKLDPDSDYVRLNMASCYSEIGRIDFKSGNYAAAEKNMILAAETFQKCGRKDIATSAYKNLVMIARAQGHASDVQKYEAKALSLQK